MMKNEKSVNDMQEPARRENGAQPPQRQKVVSLILFLWNGTCNA